MRTAIVIVKAVTPCLILGAISLMLLANIGCKEVEIVQAVELDETKIMTLDELNRELETDQWCDTRKIEAIPYTEPQQFLITLRRQ
jgi:hypothetical protein